MKFLKLILASLFLGNISSCIFSFWSSNYDFKTTAVYLAPKTQAKAFVATTGYVPKDADNGDPDKAHIDAKIIFNKTPHDTFRIISNGYKILNVEMNGQIRPKIDSSNYDVTLLNYAKLISSSNLDSSELSELANAILQTGGGPKGTYFRGQTKFITVDTVYYTTTERQTTHNSVFIKLWLNVRAFNFKSLFCFCG